MGTLRLVRIQEIEAIAEGTKVALMPICMGDPGAVSKADGNAIGLAPAIGRNKALSGALAAEGFAPEDVYGIYIGSKSVLLYVHKD